MVEHQPYHHPHLDCAGMAIHSVLRLNGYSQTETVWKQCGMIYRRDPGSALGTLSGDYMWATENLQWIHGIQMAQRTELDCSEFERVLRMYLSERIPIIVYADVGRLPYSPFYLKHHEQHSFVVIGDLGDHLLICDDYYRYQGAQPVTEIVAAANGWVEVQGVMRELPHPHATIFVPKPEGPKPLDMIEVVEMNFRVLREDYPPERVASSLGLPEGCEVRIGLSSARAFVQDVKDLVGMAAEITDQHRDVLYYSLSNVANSRHMYASVLDYLASDVRPSQGIAETYRDLGRGWQVAANMVLKVHVAGREREFLGRMANRVEETLEREQVALDETTDVLRTVGIR